MRNLKIQSFILMFSAFTFGGCSTWTLKKKCESTNWFEHGKNIASSGQYIEGDDWVRQCRKVERFDAGKVDLGFKSGRESYCSYKSIFEQGAKGQPVNFKMCDGLKMEAMVRSHQDGLKGFCTRDNGYAFGSTGGIYLQVCSKEQEKEFLSPYYRGRKEHLSKRLAADEVSLREQMQLSKELSSRRSGLESELSYMPKLERCEQRSVFDPKAQQQVNRLVCEADPWVVNRRRAVEERLNEARREESEAQARAATLRTSVDSLRLELSKVPESL